MARSGISWTAERCLGGEERVAIRIRDDGKGIAADMIDRIFDPLVTTKRGQGGTGLGLAISRRIVNANDGEITVRSAAGKGAEFTVDLPRALTPVRENWSGTHANSDR